ncbi:hypothetical protein BLNAU_14940 [Blattamonas nauphoetae]|uniref:Uncharacterized protein n=1 Tax=Blattamonas nauphoetae TaxID=2049346 RepID=A0ABQ9XCA7_9EUKA|nr:hypothetical protein BLNAU_14940 [Blattamonas nauphoetae]
MVVVRLTSADGLELVENERAIRVLTIHCVFFELVLVPSVRFSAPLRTPLFHHRNDQSSHFTEMLALIVVVYHSPHPTTVPTHSCPSFLPSQVASDRRCLPLFSTDDRVRSLTVISQLAFLHSIATELNSLLFVG